MKHCKKCGGELGISNANYCSTCAELRNISGLKRRARLKAEGKCASCAGDRGPDGTSTYCRACLKRESAYRKRQAEMHKKPAGGLFGRK